MTLYKVLDAYGRSCNGGDMQWSLPTHNKDGTWTPGEWMPEIEGPLVECWNGYHLATMEKLPQWLDERIFVAEVDGELVESTDHYKWVARKVRLVSETVWDERTARLFSADCAGHVLHLYEREYPDDSRPRQAIETTRKFANGEATKEELAAARAAAWAARSAAESAAWAAAGAAWAARSAAESAAWAARYARAAAGASAGSAAWAARSAAESAAWAARYARAAAGAECKWQSLRLAEYLEVAPDAANS